MHSVRALGCLSAAVFLLAGAASATTLPRLSFEELTDTADMIVSGKVTRSWSTWDASHKYIWTHYEVAVAAAHKGATSSSVEIAEPGGLVDGVGMAIAGSVQYAQDEQVLIFATRMPNGFLRTTGWGQGKYTVDQGGVLHADIALKSAELVAPKTSGETTPTALRSLDGMSVRELRGRIAARVALVQRGGR